MGTFARALIAFSVGMLAVALVAMVVGIIASIARWPA